MTPIICDSCSDAAFEEGATPDMMPDVGADMPDHLCDQRETDGIVDCNCGCGVYH